MIPLFLGESRRRGYLMRTTRTIVAVALLLKLCTANAVSIVIPSFPPSIILIAVGSFGGTIDEVSFNIPAANVGDGTPVVGSPTIRVLVAARAAPANSRIVGLVADSTTPLSSGTTTIPFSEISWTSSDTGIPSGTFNDGVQLLMTFFNSRIVYSDHTFSYSNSQVLAAGTYTGRVTYTLIMP